MQQKNKTQSDLIVSPFVAGANTYLAFILFGFIPLLIYVIDFVFKMHLQHMFLYSGLLTLLVFTAIGLMKSHVAHTKKIKSIFETLLLGIIAAGLAYIVGNLLSKAIQ